MYKNIYILVIDLADMKLYSVLRMLSYICTQSHFPPLTTTFVYQIYYIC